MKELDKLIDQIDAGMLGTDEAVKQVNQYFQEMNGGEEKNVSEETSSGMQQKMWRNL